MDLQSTKRINEKDINKLEKQYAKGKVYIAGIIKEQESIINLCESEIKKINIKIQLVRKKLYPYLEDKERDHKYIVLKEKYEDLIMNRNSLQQSINVAAESIEAAKLHEI